MKSIYLALLAISFSFSLYAQGVVSQNGRLRVRGNTIHNENNVPYSVAGNSFFGVVSKTMVFFLPRTCSKPFSKTVE